MEELLENLAQRNYGKETLDSIHQEKANIVKDPEAYLDEHGPSTCKQWSIKLWNYMVALYNSESGQSEYDNCHALLECYGRELALQLLKCTFPILLGDDLRADYADMSTRTAKRFFEMDEPGLAKLHLSESHSVIKSMEKTAILSKVIHGRISKVKFHNRILMLLLDDNEDKSWRNSLFDGVNEVMALPETKFLITHLLKKDSSADECLMDVIGAIHDKFKDSKMLISEALGLILEEKDRMDLLQDIVESFPAASATDTGRLVVLVKEVHKCGKVGAIVDCSFYERIQISQYFLCRKEFEAAITVLDSIPCFSDIRNETPQVKSDYINLKISLLSMREGESGLTQIEALVDEAKSDLPILSGLDESERLIYRESRELFKAKKFSFANRYLKICLALTQSARNKDTYNTYLAKCYIKLNRFEAAREAIEKLKGSSWYQVLSLENSLECGDNSSIDNTFEEIMSSGNLDIQLCLEACRLLFEKQLYEKCVTLLQRPLENFNEATPGYNEVLSKLFTIAGLLDVDEMEKIVKTALPYVEKVVGLAPKQHIEAILDSIWNHLVDQFEVEKWSECRKLALECLQICRKIGYEEVGERLQLLTGLYCSSFLSDDGCCSAKECLECLSLLNEVGATQMRSKKMRSLHNPTDVIWMAKFLAQAMLDPAETIEDFEKYTANVTNREAILALVDIYTKRVNEPSFALISRLLRKLMETGIEAGDVESDIVKVAMLMRGIIIATTLSGSLNDSVTLFKQALETVDLCSSYPEDEIEWLSISAFNMSQSIPVTEKSLAISLAEVSLNLCMRLTTNRQIYEPQIKKGYAALKAKSNVTKVTRAIENIYSLLFVLTARPTRSLY